MGKFSIPTPQDILEAAKSKGWSVKRLCDEAGISDETFFRWRDGRANVGIDKVQALVEALNRHEPDKSTDIPPS